MPVKSNFQTRTEMEIVNLKKKLYKNEEERIKIVAEINAYEQALEWNKRTKKKETK